MPGPSNKKKLKNQLKALKKTSLGSVQIEKGHGVRTIDGLNNDQSNTGRRHSSLESTRANGSGMTPGLMPQTPFIHDPGNGPRVRDARAFISSPFAQPPALDDPLCAEFAQEEVLEMLMSILPEEVAYILWYNKSRSTSRVCPACQRLYRLGDVLADHLAGQQHFQGMESSPKLRREQTLSGLCSSMCFIMASYSYPSAIKPAWGHTAEELDDYTWALLNGRPESTTGDVGLTLLMRMTRLPDLGLARLCLGLDTEDMEDLYST